MDIVEMLVTNVLKTEYKCIPQEAIDITKLAMLDTIGCIIAGTTTQICNSVREQVVDWGGKKEGTIMVFGDKVPCPNTAFINSTMARALDFDTHWVRGVHMNAVSVPTALAVAETCKSVNGKQLLAAIVAGEDLAARVHLSTSDYNGFEPTGVCGILGVAAIAGKILGLDERGMSDALAIALNRSAGSFQSDIDGALVARLIEGFASKSGIESALLAQRGVTGGKDVLQGVYGYFHLFSDDKYDAEILTERLGMEFLGAQETQFKKYPACGGVASAIEATIKLVDENSIRPEDIEKITVDSNPVFYNLCGKAFKIGVSPQIDAQSSYQYAVANAIVRGRFEIQDITPEAINDPEVLRIVEKVQPRVNLGLEKESFRATIVDINTKDGKRYYKQVNYPRGDKLNRMNREEVIEKFRSCIAVAQIPLLARTTERIIEAIDELECLIDVNELIQLLIAE